MQAPLYAVRRCDGADAVRAACVCLRGHAADSACARAQQPVACGAAVYFVVGRSTFIEDVQKLHVKGYDASGKYDDELEEEEDFSDDEKARPICCRLAASD